MSNDGKGTVLVRETRDRLVDRFPLCFFPKGHAKKALKVGIIRDLYHRCPDIEADLLRKTLSDYCAGPSYQAAIVLGAPRFDVDGKLVGTVLQEHADRAATVFAAFPEDVRERWTGKGNPAEARAATG